MSDRRSLIIPSLLIIGSVGAIKCALVPGVKYAVQSTAAKSSGTVKSQLTQPTLSWEKFGIWGGGVALLSVISLTLGETENLGEVIAAVLALGATSIVVTNWSDVSTALHLTGGTKTQATASSGIKAAGI